MVSGKLDIAIGSFLCNKNIVLVILSKNAVNLLGY